MKNMEFDYVVNLFQSLSSLRHKNRILGKYLRHLKNISTDDEKLIEVDALKDFILKNPRLNERIFTKPEFRIKKDKFYLDFINSFADEKIKDDFWNCLNTAEPIMFPHGKPEIKEEASALVNNSDLQNIIESDPMLNDVMGQIVKSGAMEYLNEDGVDVSKMTQNPKFPEMITNITKNLSNGTYTLGNLGQTMKNINGLLGDDVNPDVKIMMNSLQKTVSDLKNGKKPDLNEIIGMITKMGLSPDMLMAKGGL